MKNIIKYGIRYPLAITLAVPLIIVTFIRIIFLAFKSRSKSDEEANDSFRDEVSDFFYKYVFLFSWAETGK